MGLLHRDRSPYRSPFSATGSTPTKPTRPPDASAASSPEVQGHSLELCPDTEVQATISGLEKAGVGEDGWHLVWLMSYTVPDWFSMLASMWCEVCGARGHCTGTGTG